MRSALIALFTGMLVVSVMGCHSNHPVPTDSTLQVVDPLQGLTTIAIHPQTPEREAIAIWLRENLPEVTIDEGENHWQLLITCETTSFSVPQYGAQPVDPGFYIDPVDKVTICYVTAKLVQSSKYDGRDTELCIYATSVIGGPHHPLDTKILRASGVQLDQSLLVLPYLPAIERFVQDWKAANHITS